MYVEPSSSKWGGQIFDYQLIVVDDGSKDNTPQILDDFAKNNGRLIVFHKENGGPAAARKYGIDNSESDFLAFCDADDYVDEDWLLTMYKYLKQYNADISRIMAYINDKDVNKTHPEPPMVNVWNQDETYEKYIEHKEVNGTLWTSLFKRNLFDGLEWNFEMRRYEDDYLMWQILEKINKLVKIRIPKYHYMFCPTSLTNNSYSLNHFESTNILIDRIFSDCKKMGAHLCSASRMWYQWRFGNYLYFSNSGNMTREIKKEMRNTLLGEFGKYITNLKGIKNRISLISLIISPALTARLYQLIKRRLVCAHSTS